jgi:hypothetical protein
MASFFATTEYGIDDEDGADGADDDPYACKVTTGLNSNSSAAAPKRGPDLSVRGPRGLRSPSSSRPARDQNLNAQPSEPSSRPAQPSECPPDFIASDFTADTDVFCKPVEVESAWTLRMKKSESCWTRRRRLMFLNCLRRHCPPSIAGIRCAMKECTKLALVFCNTCASASRVYYCADCDLVVHGGGIEACGIHDREVEDTTTEGRPFMKKVGPTVFLQKEDGEGGSYKPVTLRLCLMPHLENGCGNALCSGHDKPPWVTSRPVEDKGQEDIVVVVTMRGRFVFTKGMFVCNYCGWSRVHEVDDDYNGFAPGTPGFSSRSFQFKVATDCLDFYNALLTNNPQSLEGFCHALDDCTKLGNREGTILYEQFRTAWIEYKRLTSDICTITGLTPNDCPACPESDRTAEIVDGNMKTFRYRRQREKHRESYYNDLPRRLFLPDSLRDQYFGMIYKNGYTDAVDNRCGSTQFVALSADEFKSKAKDEHGSFFRACDHMVLNSACNIDHGEMYGYHSFLSHYAAPPDVKRKVAVHTSDIC